MPFVLAGCDPIVADRLISSRPARAEPIPRTLAARGGASGDGSELWLLEGFGLCGSAGLELHLRLVEIRGLGSPTLLACFSDGGTWFPTEVTQL